VRGHFEGGLLEEVRALLDRGLGPSLTARQAIGYAEATEHLRGELPLEEAIARTAKRTRALARRQTAWFRRDPRIHWSEVGGVGGKHGRLEADDRRDERVSVGVGAASVRGGDVPVHGDPALEVVAEEVEVVVRVVNGTAVFMANPHHVLYVDREPVDIQVERL